MSEFGKANIEERENGLNNFLSACKKILDIHAPRKQKYARDNRMSFMNKALSKEIMTGTRLRNKFLKDRSEENKKKYSKQRNYCVESNHCVNALSRVMPYMSLSKKKKLLSSFFNSQFNYCPLIWMLHSRFINNKINCLHEMCLRLLYGDQSSSFEKLLEQNKSVTKSANISYGNVQSISKYISSHFQ